MAYLRADEIVLRLEEVVEDGAGTWRQIAPGTFTGDLPPGLSSASEQMRTVTGARANVAHPAQRRSADSPPLGGSIDIVEIDVEVRVLRLVTPLEQMDDASERALRALALKDGSVLQQAFEAQGNLAGTSARITGVGGIFPTGFLGGETLDVTIDTVAVSTAFLVADQSVTEVVARINAAMLAAGLDAYRASVTLAGQIQIRGRVGAGTITVTGGTGAATLGLTALTNTGTATDIVSGLLRYIETTAITVGQVDDGAQLIETAHRFQGHALTRP